MSSITVSASLAGLAWPSVQWVVSPLKETEFADISFGGSHVTPRTQAGEDLINRALKEGRLMKFEPIAFLTVFHCRPAIGGVTGNEKIESLWTPRAL